MVGQGHSTSCLNCKFNFLHNTYKKNYINMKYWHEFN